MKKKISILLTVALCISTFCMSGASAAGAVTVTDSYGKEHGIGSDVLTVKFNGEAVEFPDAQPFIDENNRTMIPLRAVTETMGAEVSWDQGSQTAKIEQNDITIVVPIGSNTITVMQNGITSTVKMDTQAVLAKDRTYVPIRFVAESLGAWVSYSDLFSNVQIYKDVLNPEEINRLHSYYDMTWGEYCKTTGYTSVHTDSDWLRGNPQIIYFTGTYGFENANEWKLRNPNGIEVIKQPLRTPTDYVGVVSGLTYTYGTQPDIDFANLVLSEVRGVEKEINGAGKLSITMKTDLSCLYFSRHSNSASAYVRGVLTVTIPINADISWIKENYDFVPNPVAGATQTIDVVVNVSTFTNKVHWSSITALI